MSPGSRRSPSCFAKLWQHKETWKLVRMIAELVHGCVAAQALLLMALRSAALRMHLMPKE